MTWRDLPRLVSAGCRCLLGAVIFAPVVRPQLLGAQAGARPHFANATAPLQRELLQYAGQTAVQLDSEIYFRPTAAPSCYGDPTELGTYFANVAYGNPVGYLDQAQAAICGQFNQLVCEASQRFGEACQSQPVNYLNPMNCLANTAQLTAVLNAMNLQTCAAVTSCTGQSACDYVRDIASFSGDDPCEQYNCDDANLSSYQEQCIVVPDTWGAWGSGNIYMLTVLSGYNVQANALETQAWLLGIRSACQDGFDKRALNAFLDTNFCHGLNGNTTAAPASDWCTGQISIIVQELALLLRRSCLNDDSYFPGYHFIQNSPCTTFIQSAACATSDSSSVYIIVGLTIGLSITWGAIAYYALRQFLRKTPANASANIEMRPPPPRPYGRAYRLDANAPV